MVTRSRCKVCRKRFIASRQSGQKQGVCSEACRVRRRRKLARERRCKDVEAFRADERERQSRRRGKLAAARASMVAGGAETVSGTEAPKCHVPASALKSLELQEEIHRILDEPFRMSRAGFGLEQRRIERKIGSIVREAVAQYGP